ncbi:MAG: alpha-glucosidase/alpha-galactosidase [Firmicutes bacterium]|nr:alpha-glucosidase/alpha-galactosidase [Bacillota bacterium]
MPRTKIVLIGAGSAVFGLGTLCDIIHAGEDLKGSTVTLVDVNAEYLETITNTARRMVKESGAELVIESTTDRREALKGAEFVIVSVAVNRIELWKNEFQIPLKYGVKHVLGENGGPGALFHSMRNIPIILNICHDIQEICPDALLLNFTNPMSRICLAVSKHTKVKAVGLCHQIGAGYRIVSQIMGIPKEELQLTAAGINHFTWITDMRKKDSNEDLYPKFREKLSIYDPTFEPLSRFLYDTFGLFPATGDGHAGEYVAFAGEIIGTKGYDYDAYEKGKDEMWQRLDRINSGKESVDPLLKQVSGERAIPIICGILKNTCQYELAVNIPNDGHIANLPNGSIVEVPAVVNASGVHGIHIGELPYGIAALCNKQLMVQELVVEAAITGDRNIALQALLLDPLITSADAAKKILDELLELEADYLPQFSS